MTDFKKQCLPCAENCSKCTGKDFKFCIKAKIGFFFDFNQNSIKKCSEGCAYCRSETECHQCNNTFYPTEQKQITQGHLDVTCKKCPLDNCRHCVEK